MSSLKHSDFPPFPDDAPVADIPIISLQHLEDEGDGGQEAARLFDACRQCGFLLLDLRDSTRGSRLFESAKAMFDVTTETMNLDRAILDRFACKPPEDLLGYKPQGVMTTTRGKLDKTEVYTIAQEDFLGMANARGHPLPIESRREEIRDHILQAQAVVTTLLKALDTPLGLPLGTLARSSTLSNESATLLRLLLVPPQSQGSEEVTFGGHTDIGLITLLFNLVGGLQILPAGKANADDNWRYIRPKAGHAIVNIGDTFVEWTGGILRSSLHRVVTPPGAQHSTPRISLAYLVRPAPSCSMQHLRGDGKVIPFQEQDGETRSFDSWSAQRALDIIKGRLNPRTTGGIAIMPSRSAGQ